MDKIPMHKGQGIDIRRCKRQDILGIGCIEDKDFSFPKEPCAMERKPGESQTPQTAVIDFPPQEAIQNTHFVPWNYHTNSVTTQDGTMRRLSAGPSGRPRVEQDSSDTRPTADWDGKRKRHATTIRPSVSIREVEDFLGSMGRNEYAVVDQLTKPPAQISVWDLMQTSESHRMFISKALSEVHIPANMPPEKLGGILKNVLQPNVIHFTESELTFEGKGHNKALYIAVKCEGRTLPQVMIDNGSALNICPLGTLSKLGIPHDRIRGMPKTIGGFDGSKCQTLGDVELLMEIGPALFPVTCQVIPAADLYNLLLGRPWIHEAEAVPSSLHRMVKFVHGSQLITVFSDDDYAMAANYQAKTHGFGEFPIPFLTHDVIPTGQDIEERLTSKLMGDKAAIMVTKELIRTGFQVGCGLGRNLQGIRRPIVTVFQRNTFGLGFRPSATQMQELRRLERANEEGRAHPMVFPHLNTTFPQPMYTAFRDILIPRESL